MADIWDLDIALIVGHPHYTKVVKSSRRVRTENLSREINLCDSAAASLSLSYQSVKGRLLANNHEKNTFYLCTYLEYMYIVSLLNNFIYYKRIINQGYIF